MRMEYTLALADNGRIRADAPGMALPEKPSGALPFCLTDRQDFVLASSTSTPNPVLQWI